MPVIPATQIRPGWTWLRGAGGDQDRGAVLLGSGHPRGQPGRGDRPGGRGHLALADLGQQMAAGCQPSRRPGRHPPQHLQAVRAAVQGHPRLVVAGFRRQQPHLAGGHVGHVGQQDVRPGRAAGRAAARTGHPGTPGRPRRPGYAGRSAPRPGRCRRRAPRPGPRRRPAPRPGRPSRSTGPPPPLPAGPAAMAWPARNSVRRRGTKTAGSTAIRRPQNSAQPSTCSSGWPPARRSTSASSSASLRAAEISRSASSSA